MGSIGGLWIARHAPAGIAAIRRSSRAPPNGSPLHRRIDGASFRVQRRRCILTDKDWIPANAPDSEGWAEEADGTSIWPMQGFACRMIGNRIPVMRIDYLRPPGSSTRSGTLQVHLSSQQACLLAGALLRAVETLE
jgi:hypothetical protein